MTPLLEPPGLPCRVNLTVETYLLMASLIETALDLLTGAAVDGGRRWESCCARVCSAAQGRAATRPQLVHC